MAFTSDVEHLSLAHIPDQKNEGLQEDQPKFHPEFQPPRPIQYIIIRTNDNVLFQLPLHFLAEHSDFFASLQDTDLSGDLSRPIELENATSTGLAIVLKTLAQYKVSPKTTPLHARVALANTKGPNQPIFSAFAINVNPQAVLFSDSHPDVIARTLRLALKAAQAYEFDSFRELVQKPVDQALDIDCGDYFAVFAMAATTADHLTALEYSTLTLRQDIAYMSLEVRALLQECSPSSLVEIRRLHNRHQQRLIKLNHALATAPQSDGRDDFSARCRIGHKTPGPCAAFKSFRGNFGEAKNMVAAKIARGYRENRRCWYTDKDVKVDQVVFECVRCWRCANRLCQTFIPVVRKMGKFMDWYDSIPLEKGLVG